MDLNTWSFILSVVGLILGFVSSYAHIKNFSLRALKAGGDAAERWLQRSDAQADFYISYPSALIAHIAYRSIMLLAILAAGLLVLKPGSGSPLPIPEWTSATLRLALAFSFGHVMASLTETVGNVTRRAKKKNATKMADG